MGVGAHALIEPWNRLAGWPLFRADAPLDRSEVLIRPGPLTWVECVPDYAEAYRRCTVWAATPSILTLQHELGHVLGLADHIQTARLETNRHANPGVCDEPRDHRYSAYRGVMSYCDWDQIHMWFGVEDRAMLEHAGYLSQDHGAGPGPWRWSAARR